jgi:hypothetical protein
MLSYENNSKLTNLVEVTAFSFFGVVQKFHFQRKHKKTLKRKEKSKSKSKNARKHSSELLPVCGLLPASDFDKSQCLLLKIFSDGNEM